MAPDPTSNFSDPTGISENISKAASQLKIASDSFAVALGNMEGGALSINKQFGQSRQRIIELKLAVADATPVVDRLGGTLSDAVETTRQISEATRRNVVASAEDVGKLYAAGQILDTGVKGIVESFQDVGVQFSQVGTQLENSISYIQSVGVNAGQVMGKVMENMSQMNRFNFQDGVQGLTRMATQATLLKFDMGQVFTLADKALDPQGAIELSSAFQRLGLAAGGLTDPFELMYKSLNDPEGLQDSLVEMTKQFTYFDEKTKSFKINPAGMLQLRELQNQTGLSAAEMSKLALNTADLDRKLSTLQPQLTFKNEEDKMYLANIAKMGEGGEYTVDIFDNQGNKNTEKLQNLTQEQLDLLIEQEKDRPKDIEEIQRSQLLNIETISGDLRAIRDKVVLGTASAPKISLLSEDLGTITKIATNSLNKGVSQEKIRTTVNDSMGDIKDIIKKMASGQDTGLDFQKLLEKSKGAFDIEKLKENLTSQMGKIKNEIPSKIKERYDFGGVDLSGFFKKLNNWSDSLNPQKYPIEESRTYKRPDGNNNQYPIEQSRVYDKTKGTGLKYPMEDSTKYKGFSTTKIDTESINIGDRGLTELLQSMAKNQSMTVPQNIPEPTKGFSTTKIDTESINIGDRGLTELLQSMAKNQSMTVPQNIPGPTTNIPQQPIVNGNPMASNTTTHNHIFDGTITWKIDAPPELDTKRFYAMIDKQEFKDTFTKIVIDKFKETEQTSISQNA